MSDLKKLEGAEATAGIPKAPALPMQGMHPIGFGEALCQDLRKASSKEWLVANGIGGYASSSILGLNTRRYHGLLVAATQPPAGRIVTLAKVEETVSIPGGRFELSTNRYGNVIHPEGYKYLVEFRLDPWPTFFFRIGEILLEKEVFMLPGENATVIGYTLHAASGPVELSIRPLAAMRDFRQLAKENEELDPALEQGPNMLSIRPYEDLPPLVIHHTAEIIEPSPCWYKNFEYEEGPGRPREDLWSFGVLRYLLRVGESCSLVASLGRRGSGDLVFHRRRMQNTQVVIAQNLQPPGKGPLSSRLAWTAESFFARHVETGRPAGETALLAGFPWFAPWGRDALIALPGLALDTGRVEQARAVLQTLASHVKGGLIPVRFSETEGVPEYDSADTSLWFFWAVWHYWKATKDLKFISKKLLDAMQEILEGYLEGTNYGIAMDEDGLIRLSDEDVPLTWMDAREPSSGDQPGRAVTPRFGKPVEVNALWYCTLVIMAHLAEKIGLKRVQAYTRLSKLVRLNFVRAFATPKGTLYDRVMERGPDATLRPNMLIAASLPFTPLSRAHGLAILSTVEKHLLTPVGIRSLAPDHPDYKGRFQGDLLSKARAYHQGTVWTWLIGPYVSALCKFRGMTRATHSTITAQLKPFLPHLEEGCLGSVSELFDGDAPHQPRGGLSQAWSVGELLRAIREANLTEL